MEQFKYLGPTLTNQNSIQKEIKEQPEVGECVLSCGAESFVFQFAIKKDKDKDKDIHNYYFSCRFIWVWNLVAHIEGGTLAEGCRE